MTTSCPSCRRTRPASWRRAARRRRRATRRDGLDGRPVGRHVASRSRGDGEERLDRLSDAGHEHEGQATGRPEAVLVAPGGFDTVSCTRTARPVDHALGMLALTVAADRMSLLVAVLGVIADAFVVVALVLVIGSRFSPAMTRVGRELAGRL